MGVRVQDGAEIIRMVMRMIPDLMMTGMDTLELGQLRLLRLHVHDEVLFRILMMVASVFFFS